MNKHICIREAYDWIFVGDKENQLTKFEFESLIKYLESKKQTFKSTIVDIGYNKLRLINYVGIIKIKNVIIEILPKVSLSDDTKKDKEILLRMLSKCKKLPFVVDESMNLSTKNYNLIDLFAKYFVNMLKNEVSKGIYREYSEVCENLNYMKGKLILKEHIKLNHTNKTKAFCKYDEYNENNFLNNTLNYACDIVLRNVMDSNLKSDILKIKSCFFENNHYIVDKNKLSNYKFTRQNVRFKQVFEFAKLIILNNSMETNVSNENGFTMLFEMNTLFEEYIGKVIKSIWTNNNKECLLQNNSKYLLQDSNTKTKKFNLRPDIVLNDKVSDYQIIIDTKWKNSKVKQSDIYQMYAYVTRYEKARSCVLLYPYNSQKILECEEFNLYSPFCEKTIKIKTVRLDEVENTIFDLEKIINNF